MPPTWALAYRMTVSLAPINTLSSTGRRAQSISMANKASFRRGRGKRIKLRRILNTLLERELNLELVIQIVERETERERKR